MKDLFLRIALMGSIGTALVVPAFSGGLFAEASIREVRVSGTGCELEDVGAVISDDGQALTLLFSRLLAEAEGPDDASQPHRSKKNCRVKLLLDVPVHRTLALVRADYRGFAELQRGSKAVHVSRYKVGRQERSFRKSVIKGPFSGDFERFDDIDLGGSPLYLPCNGKRKRRLVINNVLRVRSRPGSAGFIVLDSLDVELGPVSYALRWKNC